MTFTNTGGLGGAGIIVPVMLGLFRFNAQNAVALSNFSAPTSGVMRYITFMREAHPLKNGYGVVTDYNIITLILPAAIFGASIGTIVNLIMPGPVILVLFVMVTSATAILALKKYCKLRASEISKFKVVELRTLET